MAERDLVRFFRAACTDSTAAADLLAARPGLVLDRLQRQEELFLAEGGTQVYAGDTALHAAAFSYRAALARRLVESGADLHARNRRGAQSTISINSWVAWA